MITCKWALEIIKNAHGKAVRHKASQNTDENLDYANLSCTFADVVNFTVIWLMLSIFAQRQWIVHQIE